jgi:hypothetical protein
MRSKFRRSTSQAGRERVSHFNALQKAVQSPKAAPDKAAQGSPGDGCRLIGPLLNRDGGTCPWRSNSADAAKGADPTINRSKSATRTRLSIAMDGSFPLVALDLTPDREALVGESARVSGKSETQPKPRSMGAQQKAQTTSPSSSA